LRPLEGVREWRERRMLSQQELADRAGVSLFTIQRIERGEGSVRPKTGRAVAKALGVAVEDLLPKVDTPPSLEPTFHDVLGEEWRAQHLGVWKRYLSGRVEWCEKVVEKRPEDDWNNPFLSLDTAIQWAIYVGIESVQLRNIVQTEVLPYANAEEQLVAELRTLLNRLSAVDNLTNVQVRAMMDEAGLNKEDKEQRLRLIEGAA